MEPGINHTIRHDPIFLEKRAADAPGQPAEAAKQLLKKKVTRGQDLTPHLHTKLKVPQSADNLLNHWDIHHFHLGTRTKKSGYVTRTSALACARVTVDVVYFITTLTHEQLNEVNWAKQELVETIHRNWPKSIDCYRMKGLVAGSRLSDEDTGQLWEGHVNHVYLTSDGTMYAPIGGGVMCSGDSHDALAASDSTLRKVDGWQEAVREKEDAIRQAIKEHRDVAPESLRMEMVVKGGFAFAVEHTHEMKFKLGIL